MVVLEELHGDDAVRADDGQALFDVGGEGGLPVDGVKGRASLSAVGAALLGRRHVLDEARGLVEGRVALGRRAFAPERGDRLGRGGALDGEDAAVGRDGGGEGEGEGDERGCEMHVCPKRACRK